MLTFHFRHIIEPTNCRKPRYLSANLSNLENMRRQCFTLPIKHPTKCRSRYRYLSYVCGSLRFDRDGITATAPLLAIDFSELIGVVSPVRYHILAVHSVYESDCLSNVMFLSRRKRESSC